MTWEIVALIALIPVCFTVLVSIFVIFSEPVPDEEIQALKAAIAKLEAEHEGVHKLAEDTKKLLSQSNVAVGFLPRSMR